MRVSHWLLAGALAVAAAGCALGDEFHCATQLQCGGNGSRCESTGYCSFADAQCGGGWRYGHYARRDLADRCVAVAAVPCSGHLLCDSFDGAIAPAWQLRSDPSGAVTVENDAAHIYRGSGALKIHVEPGPFANVGLAHLGPPIVDNTLYARFFVLVPSTFAGSFVNAPQLAVFAQVGAGYGDADVQLEDSGALSAITHPPVQGGGNMTSTAQLRTGSWQCLELQVHARTDASSDSFVAVELQDATGQGPPAARVTPVTVDPSQPLNALQIGVAGQLTGSTPFELWIDELIVDDKAIGCAQ